MQDRRKAGRKAGNPVYKAAVQEPGQYGNPHSRNHQQQSASVEPVAVHKCMYVPWYEFKKCTVTTCKNHTEAVSNGCLALNRVIPEGAKVISDEELRLFKFSGKKITTRLVSEKRKQAVDRVRAALIVREYVKYIREEHHIPGQQAVFTYTILLKLQRRFPLNLKPIGFENWMWEHLLDADTFAKFKQARRGGECGSVRLQDILALNDERWALLKQKLAGVFQL